VLGLEPSDFQLEGHEAGEPSVEEDEVDREIPVADLHGVFRADEAEVATELGDEATEVAKQRRVQICFGVVVAMPRTTLVKP